MVKRDSRLTALREGMPARTILPRREWAKPVGVVRCRTTKSLKTPPKLVGSLPLGLCDSCHDTLTWTEAFGISGALFNLSHAFNAVVLIIGSVNLA